MAEKRMFSKSMIDSDVFLEMPGTTQLLYFHLGMRADDDGFVDSPKMIMRMTGCKGDDLNILIAKGFVNVFDSGVVIINHWKIHNYIPKDRYRPTNHQTEKMQITEKDKVYYLGAAISKAIEAECIQDVYEMDTQIRIDKNRLDKNRLDTPFYPPAGEKEIFDCNKEIDNSKFSDELKKALKDWVTERGSFSQLALEKLLEQVDAAQVAHGDNAVIYAINSGISSKYKRIPFEMLGKYTAKENTQEPTINQDKYTTGEYGQFVRWGASDE